MDRERFQLDYKDAGDLIRHYSSVRSALTTFLLTVALGALVAYTRRPVEAEFMIGIAHVLLLVSFAVCIVFSLRTIHMEFYQTQIWRWSNTSNSGYPSRKTWPAYSELARRVITDPMNGFLLFTIAAIMISFNFQVVGRLSAETIQFWSYACVSIGLGLLISLGTLGIALVWKKVWPAIVGAVLLTIAWLQYLSLIHGQGNFWERLAAL